MSNNLSFYRVRIQHAQVESLNGCYYFRERQHAEEYIHEIVEREIKELGDLYFNGCDGCGYCCYGDVSKKEWCQETSKRKPQNLVDCLVVCEHHVDVDLDLVTWKSKESSKLAHVEEIWSLCRNPLMQGLSVKC